MAATWMELFRIYKHACSWLTPDQGKGTAHLERSSGVRFSGLLVSAMPSFLRRLSMTGAKLRAPPLPAGHNLLNSAVSLCMQDELSKVVTLDHCFLAAAEGSLHPSILNHRTV